MVLLGVNSHCDHAALNSSNPLLSPCGQSGSHPLTTHGLSDVSASRVASTGCGDSQSLQAKKQANTLEFSQPGVGNDGAQDGSEVAEAAEGMIDGSGEVLVPPEVVEEIQRQHRYDQTDKH